MNGTNCIAAATVLAAMIAAGDGKCCHRKFPAAKCLQLRSFAAAREGFSVEVIITTSDSITCEPLLVQKPRDDKPLWRHTLTADLPAVAPLPGTVCTICAPPMHQHVPG